MLSCSLPQSSSFLLVGHFACISGLRRCGWQFTKLACSSRLSLTASICSFSSSSSLGPGERRGGRRSASKQKTPTPPTITSGITTDYSDDAVKSKGVRTNKHQTLLQLQQELQRLQQNTIANPPTTTTTTTNSTTNTTTAPSSPPSSSLTSPPQPTRAGGFMGVIAEGMAHGVGWAFGQRAVDALMGPRQMEVVHHNDEQQGGVEGSGGASHDDTSEGGAAGGYTNSSYPADDGFGGGETEEGGGFFGNMFGGGDDEGGGGGGGWGGDEW
eukprot:GHVS01025419.1.p1 GENE.GHVS01025419.1~~GHVS01025419.1.p1  ORF type:complete len:270 (+),score=98.67 GHVS01025419.1:184-993(+)